MSSARLTLLVLSLALVAKSDPFFGNNYRIPQSADLVRYSNAVVNSLNTARNSLSTYVRSPPTASVSLNRGATTLLYYVGNVSSLVGNVYTQVSRAANDRSTAPAVVFSSIQIHLNALQPLLQNGSLYVSSLAENFDYEGDNSTSSYLAVWHENLQSSSQQLEGVLANISRVIDSIAGQGFNTQQFIAALSVDGLLQNLLDVAQEASFAAADLSNVVSRLVSAINNANSFRSMFNSRAQTGAQSTNTVVNNYITSSNTSFNQILTSTDTLFNHLKTVNDSFVFRWPLLLSESVEQKLNLLNRSIESLHVNLHFRRVAVESHYSLTRLVFANDNVPQTFLRLEAELLGRRLLNVINPSDCVNNFRTQFLNLPGLVQTRLSECFTSQLRLEQQGASQVQLLANNFLRGYVTAIYGNLEICYSHPFDKMNDCLDEIVNTIDFSAKFFLLDTVTFYLFEQVQSELINCHARLVRYVQDVGLVANCQ